ncbi:MAG: putative ABC exporter domain-containing protein [Gemmatimonadales bacterium]
MIGAALYLSRRSFANATRRRLARLRQPKYLIGFVAGLLYFYWLIVRPGGQRPAGGAIIPGLEGLGETMAVAGLAALVLSTWIFGSAETPFTFHLAETDFLFTAPLTRRQVIHFRLVRTQLPLLVSALFSVLLFSRGHVNAELPLRVAALWLLYLTLQLHYAGAALLRGSLAQQGMTGVRRKLVTLAGLAAALAAVWWGLRDAVPGIVAAWGVDSAAGAAELSRALRGGALGVALWPLYAATGPLLASGPPEFIARLPAALLVAGAHYVWVVRSTLAFEEAAVEHAAKVARRIEAMRRGRVDVTRRPRTLIALGPTGSPAAAIVWKNVTGALREFRARTLVLLLVMVVALGGALGGRGGAAELIAILSLALAGLAMLFGPLTLRYDLRRDLELLDVLKSWPVRGRDLVGAEALAPALLVSGVAALGLCGAFAASLASDLPLPPVSDRVAILVAALAVVPAVVAVLFLVQNAAALLFPAWTAIGPERATGFEATGQRILSFVGTAFALVVAVLPAALVGGVAAVVARQLGVPSAWVGTVWGMVGAVTLGVEGYLGVMVLGPMLDRLEPASLR